MLLTLRCMGVVLGGLFAVGVPLRWILNWGRPLSKREWLEAPFLGAAVPVLVLHNLVYFDVPIGVSAPWLWLAVAGLWALMLLRRHLTESLRAVPRAVLLASLAVFAVQGLGMFLLGADRYMGRAYSDQLNYVSFAQLLTDYPFSITPEQVGHTPYLLDPLKIIHERFGAMLLLGWFARTAFLDAKTLFGSTILLGPCLVVLPTYALARRVGLVQLPALAAAVTAGLVPGLTLIHAGCFLAHALGVPALLCSLLALYELALAPGVGRMLLTAIFLAAALALYTEFLPILAGLTVLALGGSILLRVTPWRRGLVYLLAVPAVAYLLNPLYLPTIRIVLKRSVYETTVFNPYPFALQLLGQGCLWVGDLWAFRPGELARQISWFSLAVTAVAGCGVLRYFASRLVAVRRCVANCEYRRCLLLATCLLAVAMSPTLVLAGKGARCPYQFFKLLQTVSPVLVLGVGLALGPARRLVPAGTLAVASCVRRRRVTAVLPLVGLLAVCGFGTLAIVRHTADVSEEAAFQSAHHLPGNQAWRDMAVHLYKAPPMTLVLAAGSGVFLNSWPAYFARRHRVWLTNPVINDSWRIDVCMPRGIHVLDLDTVPWQDAHLLTSALDGDHTLVAGDYSMEWTNGTFTQWKLGPGAVALRTHIEGQLSLSGGTEPNTNVVTLGSKPVVMDVWASRPVGLRLRGQFIPARVPAGESVRLRVATACGETRLLTCGPRRQDVYVQLQQGRNPVSLECLSKSGGPASAALVSIRDLALDLCEPSPQRPPPQARRGPLPGGRTGLQSIH